MDPPAELADGDRCLVVRGTHSGKAGIVQDRKLSKTGHATITVHEDSGARFKTLARNAVARPS
jgi:ribosomal protein S4E